ncbi:phthalate transporter [Colletotrichum tofieldiae]|nr:phthalate transporter [Colletotrichum tofieldiae]
MGNWTIFGFLVATAVLTGYVWYVFGSHSGYRTGTKDAAGNLEVLDAGAGDPDELMNKKMGIVTDNDKKDEEA